MNTKIIAIVTLFFLPVCELAAQATDVDKVEPVKIIVSAKTEPFPAMKYSFSRSTVPFSRGNAADYYHQAAELQETLKELKFSLKPDDPNRAREVINRYEPVFSLIDTAVGMSFCDWGLNYELGLKVDVPGVFGLDSVGRALSVKSRLELAEGNYEAAIASLKLQMVMAGDIVNGYTSSNSIINWIISSRGLVVIREFCQKGDSPSLYWALVEYYGAFPYVHRCQPTTNAIDEKSILAMFKKDLESGYFTGIEIFEVIKKVFEMVEEEEFPYGYYEYTAMVALYYTEAVEYLVSHGLQKVKMELMTPCQVVIISKWYQYVELREKTYKWFNLPFHLGYPHIQQAEAEIQEYLKQQRGKMSFAFLLGYSAMDYYNIARLKSYLELLINQEAIRLHIGQTGKLPETLAEITIVPTLPNTFTGKPFRYELKDPEHALMFNDNPEKPQTYELELIRQ